jgi:dihydrofolate reductase
MTLEIIAAVSEMSVIGMNNRLPWHLPHDFQRFRRLTFGHSVIMGRRTWEGLCNPLDGRQNIVISSKNTCDSSAKGVEFVDSMKKALSIVEMKGPIFAIGGNGIYVEALKIAKKIHMTEIHHYFEGDVFFPQFNRTEWIEKSRESFVTERPVRFSYDFVEYELC